MIIIQLKKANFMLAYFLVVKSPDNLSELMKLVMETLYICVVIYICGEVSPTAFQLEYWNRWRFQAYGRLLRLDNPYPFC